MPSFSTALKHRRNDSSKTRSLESTTHQLNFNSTVGVKNSQFEKHSTHYRLESTDEVFSEATLASLKHRDLTETNISLVHDTKSGLLATLQESRRKTFQARHDTCQQPSCFRVLLSCCFGIPVERNVSTVKHLIAVPTTCTNGTIQLMQIEICRETDAELCPNEVSYKLCPLAKTSAGQLLSYIASTTK